MPVDGVALGGAGGEEALLGEIVGQAIDGIGAGSRALGGHKGDALPVPAVLAIDSVAFPGTSRHQALLGEIVGQAIDREGAGIGGFLDLVEIAGGEVGGVEFVIDVFAEARDIVAGKGGLDGLLPATARHGIERAGDAAAVVGVDIVALHGRVGAAAVDVAAGDGAIAADVVVGGDGLVVGGLRRAACGVVGGGTFVTAPAIILATAADGRLDVDFFVQTLADIADEHGGGGRVKAPAPGVAQAHGPDFGRAGLAHKRIAGRDDVMLEWIAGEGVAIEAEAQDFAEERILVLGVVGRVAASPTVAGADVEVAVVEHEVAAVVIGLAGVADGYDDLFARRIGDIGVAGAAAEARDDDVAFVVDVVDVEQAVGGVIGVEGQAQQALLAAVVGDEGIDVEERRAEDGAIGLDDLDDAGLLNHKQPRVAGHAGVDDVDGTGETGGEGSQAEAEGGGVGGQSGPGAERAEGQGDGGNNGGQAMLHMVIVTEADLAAWKAPGQI